MNTLFPLHSPYPEGFSYFPEFISPAEESDLLKEVAKIKLYTFNFHGYEAKRKVASFGYDYDFENKSLTKGNPIPSIFYSLIEKVASQTELTKEDFVELLVTEYPIGAVINWHRDAFPFELIAGVSLNSVCTFRLRPYEKAKQGRHSVISIPVQRRSLYIIKGAARMDWEHSVAPVKNVRYSITLRSLRNTTRKSNPNTNLPVE